MFVFIIIFLPFFTGNERKLAESGRREQFTATKRKYRKLRIWCWKKYPEFSGRTVHLQTYCGAAQTALIVLWFYDYHVVGSRVCYLQWDPANLNFFISNSPFGFELGYLTYFEPLAFSNWFLFPLGLNSSPFISNYKGKLKDKHPAISEHR